MVNVAVVMPPSRRSYSARKVLFARLEDLKMIAETPDKKKQKKHPFRHAPYTIVE